MYLRERIIVIGCLAVLKTTIGLMADYCTCGVYGLINGRLHEPPDISYFRNGDISAKM